MMLGPRIFEKSTKGTKITGSAPGSPTRWRSSLSISTWIRRRQWAHSVSTRTESASSRKRPCTKGTAIASIAQAANPRSPVLKLTRCGVSSALTG